MMIKLKITDEIQTKHKKYITESKAKDKLKELKKGKEKKELSDEQLDFVDYLINQINLLSKKEWKKSIFVCDIEGIKKEIRTIEKNHYSVYKSFIDDVGKREKDSCGKSIPSFSDKIIKALGYESFSSGNPKFTTEAGEKRAKHQTRKNSVNWCAYDFTWSLGISVCPYCNRAYVNTYCTETGKTRPDLDHFLPKSKYPYLSMSIYNLVPSCNVCNSSLKGQRDFNFDEYISPYDNSMEDGLVTFSYKPQDYEELVGLDENSLEILLEYDKERQSDSKRLANNCGVFEIQGLYRNHVNVVKNMLYKRHIYSDEQIDSLYNAYKNLFKSREECEALLFDIPSKEEVKNTVLGKLKRDIYDEISF